jgi:hypothetical protein
MKVPTFNKKYFFTKNIVNECLRRHRVSREFFSILCNSVYKKSERNSSEMIIPQTIFLKIKLNIIIYMFIIWFYTLFQSWNLVSARNFLNYFYVISKIPTKKVELKKRTSICRRWKKIFIEIEIKYLFLTWLV